MHIELVRNKMNNFIKQKKIVLSIIFIGSGFLFQFSQARATTIYSQSSDTSYCDYACRDSYGFNSGYPFDNTAFWFEPNASVNLDNVQLDLALFGNPTSNTFYLNLRDASGTIIATSSVSTNLNNNCYGTYCFITLTFPTSPPVISGIPYQFIIIRTSGQGDIFTASQSYRYNPYMIVNGQTSSPIIQDIQQYKSDATTTIAEGQTTTEDKVVFSAVL